MRKRSPTALEHIELVIFDVDGVLTDGQLHFGPRGESHKSFHVRDGHGIKLLMAAGVGVAIITGRRFAGVAIRARELGVTMLVQACEDKIAACEALARRCRTALANCACLVDDTPDLPLMAAVGFAAAVADAHPLVRRAAHWISENPGGRGAARELCDVLLQARATARRA
jgi:3-deoxy-D-manno-octulosonate 8-phosphate phosphatase (KDO 8-P phosphatase)